MRPSNQIARKRKRRPLDGVDLSDLVTVGLPRLTVDETHPVASTPRAFSPDARGDTDLTVEGFLRRSCEKPHRTYKKRKLAAAQLSERAPHAYKQTRGLISTSSTAKTLTGRRPLIETLARTIALTEGHPSESIEDPHTITRRPLSFVTITKFVTPPRKKGRWDDDEIHGSNPCDSSKTPKGLSEKHVCRASRGPRKQPQRGVRSFRHRTFQDGRAPLDFVPVRDAEAAYSALFS